jgi:hypothetical protein
MQNLSTEDTVTILWLLCLTFSLADDQCSLQEENRLWVSLADPDAKNQVLEFMDLETVVLGLIRNEASTWRDDTPIGPSAIVAQRLVKNVIEASNGTSPLAFYSGRALNHIISTLATTHGWKSQGGDEWLASLDVLKSSTSSIFAAVAILSGLQEFLASSRLINHLCNLLVSDVTGAPADGEKTLRVLVLLNATLGVFEPSNLPVAQNRVVFAVKSITAWMSEDHTLSPPLAAEACRSLQLLLPSIKDVYGPHWETSINFCISLWKQKDNGSDSVHRLQQLPLLNASLRLISSLRNLTDPNEDLSEALAESARSISNGLLELLKLPSTIDSSPWIAFQNHLWRQTGDIPMDHLEDLSVLYPLIASDSFLVQSAAFLMLSRAIPAVQERISLDIVLEKKGTYCCPATVALLTF